MRPSAPCSLTVAPNVSFETSVRDQRRPLSLGRAPDLAFALPQQVHPATAAASQIPAKETAMMGLILYCILVALGTVGSIILGLVVEREFSPALSLVVFLTVFFLNFAVSWYLTVWIVDRRANTRSRQCPQCKGAGIGGDNRQCSRCHGTGRIDLQADAAPFAAA
jgi:uncharacterized paraquat-inducible protein A